MQQETITNDAVENLWPTDFDFGIGSVTPPIAILKQQATLLGQRTRNLVTGEVHSYGGREQYELRYKFYLSAPALSGYEYLLFDVYYPLIGLYPAEVHVPDSKGNEPSVVKVAINEIQLKALLKQIFSSENTLQLIRSMIAQSVATAQ